MLPSTRTQSAKKLLTAASKATRKAGFILSFVSPQRWQLGSDAALQDADLSDFRVREPRLSLRVPELNTDFTSAEKQRAKSVTVWEKTLSRRFFTGTRSSVSCWD